MKKILATLFLTLSASVYAQSGAATCAPCDCGSRVELKASESSTEEVVEKGGIALAAAAAGAFLHKKFSCERFDIVIEYRLMDACLNSCSGVASISARTEKCAKAIQDMECKKKMSAVDISSIVSSSCPR
ncbi:MAG: hypothetical protein MJY93_03365 [Fibrobacter sp.]|nr:hypothetical protein [Fibrobacter sp.]